MRVMTDSDLLALWESGRMLHPLDQALLAVRSAFPETRDGGAADWPLGRRNRALAELRCACVGPAIRGWTVCRKCGEKIEFDLDGRALADSEAPDQDATIVFDGRSYRLPSSRDLARIVSERDPQRASILLLEQCLTSGSLEPGETASREAGWNEGDLEAIGERMAAADPLAEIMLQFDCPTCGDSFQESLDLAEFLWAEIEAQARRLLREVHTLASAYGWSEEQILALKRARRELYLEMVRA
jgi:hypothetical protein